MLAVDRLIEIAEICGEIAEWIVPLDLDVEALEDKRQLPPDVHLKGSKCRL